MPYPIGLRHHGDPPSSTHGSILRRLLRLLTLAPALIILAASVDDAAAMSIAAAASSAIKAVPAWDAASPFDRHVNRSTMTGQNRIGKFRRVTDSGRPTGSTSPPRRPGKPRGSIARRVIVRLPPFMPPVTTIDASRADADDAAASGPASARSSPSARRRPA